MSTEIALRFRLDFGIVRFGRVLNVAVVAALIGASPAIAQVQSVAPPVFSSIDAAGVDASTGNFRWAATEVVIGQPGAGGLSHGRFWLGTGWRDSLAGTINSSSNVYTVSIGGSSETFTESSGSYTSVQAMGSTLVLSSGKYTYTLRDGTAIEFDTGVASCSGVTMFWACNQATITKLTRPDGEVITWTYATDVGGTNRRPQSISNNLGYQIHFTYDGSDYLKRTKVTGVNRAYNYCGDGDATCNDSTGGNWPYVTYGTESGGIETVTDRLSQTTRYVFSSGLMTHVRLPTSSSTNRIAVTYSSGKVSYLQNTITGNFSTYYTYDDASVSGLLLTTITPYIEGGASIVRTSIADGWVTEIWADTSGTRKTVLTRETGNGRITRETRADGDYTDYTYDARGNITQVVEDPVGSTLSQITTSATYPSSCSNPKWCNKPTTTTSATGQVTTYAYWDGTSSTPDHGAIKSITLPAPGSGPYSTVQPQTRFTYDSFYAWYKNSGGSLVQAPSAVYRLTEASACATGTVSSSCVGTSDETRAEFASEAGSSSVPSNLLSTTVAARSGNTSGGGALSSAATFTYTVQGDVASVDGPLSGSSDTFYAYYDDMRRLRATVSPDPDGGGSLQHRVVKTSYDADGQPTLIERGYVSSPSSWSSLTVMQQRDLAYDNSLGILSKSAISSGGTTYSVIQYGIGESFSRCTAIRMNPSEFASLPADGCSLDTTGSYGADRITLVGYNSYREKDSVLSGYLTANRTEGDRDYDDSSGVLTSLTDAAGNKTSYEYDDFFRPTKTVYPSPSTPGSSNSSDYDQVAYDAYGRINGHRTRDGNWIDSCFDSLNRVIAVKASGSSRDTSCSSPTLAYTYDSFGRVLSASQSGHSLSYAYDALGRLTSETQAGRTVSYEYDAAGRRTKMTWPDSFYVNYDLNVLGEVTWVRENGATSGDDMLAAFAYDNLGRRTATFRRYHTSTGAEAITGYSYDGASRLDVYAHDLESGSSNDVSASFAYNPANQIVGRTINNGSYNFSLPSCTDPCIDTYSANGLNQYTAAGGVNPTYTDGRGNTTYDGTKTYGYDYLNRVTSAGSTSLTYDPASRLYQVAGGTTTQLLYDGPNVIAEYVSGSVVRRYVHGPGIDEPLVWYEGSGTSDRRHLYADERGSIIAVEGSSTTINTYDEYGVPGSGNSGRFQYTGQIWLSDVGLYSYKARMYNPDLGRFMQTDPIGYAGGINLYGYVGADPINGVDPWGLQVVNPLPFDPGEIVTVTASSSGGSPSLTCGDDLDATTCMDLYDLIVRGGIEPQLTGPLIFVEIGGETWFECGRSSISVIRCGPQRSERVIVHAPPFAPGTRNGDDMAADIFYNLYVRYGVPAAVAGGFAGIWIAVGEVGPAFMIGTQATRGAAATKPVVTSIVSNPTSGTIATVGTDTAWVNALNSMAPMARKTLWETISDLFSPFAP